MLKTLIAVFIILIIGIGGYFLLNMPAANTAPATTTAATSTIVQFYCAEGPLSAFFATSSVKLDLSDGRTLELPQTISGSGIRYESGDTMFGGEGDNMSLTEGTTTTYSLCLAGAEQVKDASTTVFRNQSSLFSVAFPNTFKITGAGPGYTQDWKVGSTTLGVILAEITVPGSIQPKTNFSDARFTIGTSADPAAVASCLSEGNGGKVSTSTVDINGTPFTEISMNDAGAGNRYDTTSYRAVKDNQCYAVEYTIHSSAIENYSPDQGIKAFDRAKVTGLLEGIARSFTFL